MGGVCSLANYSVAYEETQSNRISDFRDFVCSLFPKAIMFDFYLALKMNNTRTKLSEKIRLVIQCESADDSNKMLNLLVSAKYKNKTKTTMKNVPYSSLPLFSTVRFHNHRFL